MSQASPAPGVDLANILAGASAPLPDHQAGQTGDNGPETSAAPKTTGGSKRGGAATRAYTPKREGVDWELVEAEYRGGILSINVISRNHGMSTTRLRDRAKKYGWQRDLSDAVRQQARGELLREDAAASYKRGSERDPHAQASIVKGAAATQVKIVREHRKDLAKMGAIQKRLMARLDVLTGTEDGPAGKEERIRTLSMLTEAASITESLSRNANRLIPLERQAFSLDAKGSESPGAGVSAIEERTRRYMADRQAAEKVEKAKATERAIQAGKASGKVARLEDRIRAAPVPPGFGPG